MFGSGTRPPEPADGSDQLLLGRYRVLDEAGAGGFAQVRLAWDTRMQRRVAVKAIDLSPLAASRGRTIDDIADLPDSARTGLDEARTAAMLSNANIVAVHDFEVRDNAAYIIMEYVDGLTLAQLLRAVGDGIDVDMVTAVFDGIAQALSYAHENQVLHLDIKPDNVMIDHQGQVKVMDFGLARLSDAHGYQSATGGTIGYMPPEQIMREPLDGRCDEWALASLTYEMISGENPFLAPDLSTALDRIEGAELVLPSLCLEGLPAGIDDVMFYALDPDRYKRYATVGDFAEEMDRFLGSAPAGRRELAAYVRAALDAEPAPEPMNVQRRPIRRRWTGKALGAVLRAVGGAGAGLLAFASLTSISALGGWTSPACLAGTAAVAALGAFLPRWGSLAGIAALSAALLYGGAYALGGAFAAAGLAWWAFVGRSGSFASIGGMGAALFGVAGLGQLTPLFCGYLMPPGKAAGSAAFAAALAFALGSCGTQSLMGWAAPIGAVTGATVQENALRLAGDPLTWIVAVSWVAAAAICAAGCHRRNLPGEIAGVVLGAAALVAGAFAAGWVSAGFATPSQPSLELLVPAIIALALCLLLVLLAHRLLDDDATRRGFTKR